jgi:aryl-alcohol dehydrogenase-like predicted oxidoreductase
MEFAEIPNIKRPASRIGLGTWAMGGSLWGDSNVQDSINTIHRALELGINVIDTAPGYGFGQSEEIIGKALKESGNREKVIIANKFGLNLETKTNVFRDSRPQSILAEIEASLKRLQTDYIDLYQVHWPDLHTPQPQTAQVLLDLLHAGKIRAIGVSNYTLEQIHDFTKVAPIHAIQFPFNIFEREAEATVLSYCQEHNLAALGYSSLCRGLLTGTLKEDDEFEDLRKNWDPKFKKPHFPQYLICVGRLQQWVADKYQRPLICLAIRYSLDKGVNIALWGARKPEELDPIADILDWKLTEEDFQEIDQIIRETITDPIGPQFMSPPIRNHDL